MMKSARKIFRLKLIAFSITLLLFLFYDFIPKRTLSLYPDLAVATAQSSDNDIGGNSKLIWVDEDNMSWICHMQAGAQFSYCGASVVWSTDSLTQVDLSPYSQLDIDLDYTGPAKYLRVFVRNAYPIPDSKDLIGSSKFNNIRIGAKEFEHTVSILFEKLNVADWWIDNFRIPPEDIDTEISKTIAIGVDRPQPIVFDQHHFKLRSLKAIGVYFSKETLYLAIIIFWSILLVGEVLVRHFNMKRQMEKDSRLLSKLAAESAQYKERAETDKLTGVLNREGLTEIVNQLDAKKLLHQYALLVIDLDHFKQVNDDYGHAAGDQVLEHVAKVMNLCVRSYDKVARWGGEEFVILFQCMDNSGIPPFAEKVRKKVESEVFISEKKHNITVSIGTAIIANFDTFEEAFEAADKALYEAKSSGRNKVVIN